MLHRVQVADTSNINYIVVLCENQSNLVSCNATTRFKITINKIVLIFNFHESCRANAAPSGVLAILSFPVIQTWAQQWGGPTHCLSRVLQESGRQTEEDLVPLLYREPAGVCVTLDNLVRYCLTRLKWHHLIFSVLHTCIIVWYETCTEANRKRLQGVIKAVQKIAGCPSSCVTLHCGSSSLSQQPFPFRLLTKTCFVKWNWLQ